MTSNTFTTLSRARGRGRRFWFGTKMIEKAPRRIEGPSTEDVKRVHDLDAERRFQAEMADTSKPLTNAAILEWNRRRKLISRQE